MAMPREDKVRDRMQTALAMTHHIQTRISQGMCNGRVSTNVANDVAAMCEQLTNVFATAATED